MCPQQGYPDTLRGIFGVGEGRGKGNEREEKEEEGEEGEEGGSGHGGKEGKTFLSGRETGKVWTQQLPKPCAGTRETPDPRDRRPCSSPTRLAQALGSHKPRKTLPFWP